MPTTDYLIDTNILIYHTKGSQRGGAATQSA
jgi:predicted nucleic acid-binding protein